MVTTTMESLIFASGKPVARAALKKSLGVSDEVFAEALADVRERFNREASGIHLLETDDKLQFVTNPDQGEAVAAFTKQEVSGELTRPSLETLTIIAYRGPVTKPEVEQIRGVNCSLIIRNLLMRGLIEERDDKDRLQPVYSASPEFLRHLGLTRVEDLPEYEAYHDNEKIREMIEELEEASAREDV